MSERTLYLVRHGQLDLDAFARDQRRAGLTAMGRDQARLTAERLRSLDVSAIYSSTLGRARESAGIIAQAFPDLAVRHSDLLRELPNVGPADDEARRRQFADGTQRGERAFARFVRPAHRTMRVEILVSHGNLIRYVACRVLGIPPESWSILGTSHCGITHLCVTSRENVRIICYNDTGHLPATLRS